MRLSISNIGWTNQEESEVAELLRSLGVKYIELAPTKRWDEPVGASGDEIEAYRAWWADYGIEVVAFQSMLFGHPDYKLFETEENRIVTQRYLADFIKLAGKMKAGRLVFGSPRNRQIGGMPLVEANDVAVEFFSSLGDIAQQNNTVFCIEPNAPQYSCDFVTTASEGLGLVKKVNNKGFGLHLDIACMALAGDDISGSIYDSHDFLQHFHISSPMLEQVENRSDIDHHAAAEALREIKYQGFVSIEMRPGEEGTNVDRVRKAVLFAQSVYS